MVGVYIEPRMPQALGDERKEKNILKDAAAQNDTAQTVPGSNGLAGLDDETGDGTMELPRDDG